MHFDPKKYTKNYKMRVIQNKENMISYYQLKKIGKKRIGTSQNQTEICQNWQKLVKNRYYVHFENKKNIKQGYSRIKKT